MDGPSGDLAGDGGRSRLVALRRRLSAPPHRVFRAWSDPEELVRWWPSQIEGDLAVNARSVLVWPDERVWWDVIAAEPDRSFVFRRPWTPDERLVTRVAVTIRPLGYGCRLDLEDGPFPLGPADGLDAWARAIEHWTTALAQLRAHLDFSVDLRWRSTS
ncbi:MAG TPA: SRPBCC domain-containing protein [Candidatus Baltobacteraceae bacterium]|nr:SRPBCC domain-containing protein [Candidatus Baltobacteraceae bacterium]